MKSPNVTGIVAVKLAYKFIRNAFNRVSCCILYKLYIVTYGIYSIISGILIGGLGHGPPLVKKSVLAIGKK